MGDSVSACGKVYIAYYAIRAENSPNFLNLGAEYPNQLMMIIPTRSYTERKKTATRFWERKRAGLRE